MALPLWKETDALVIAQATQPGIGHLQKLSNHLVRDEALLAEELIEDGGNGRRNVQCDGGRGFDAHDVSPAFSSAIGALASCSSTSAWQAWSRGHQQARFLARRSSRRVRT